MQMSEGVEWAVHSCLNLAWSEPGQAVTATKLAAFFQLPTAYLNKQLQALARAGIVTSTSGPRGGFRLNRSPESITLMDIVAAIEGPQEAFRCRQILRNGPNGRAQHDYSTTCAVSTAMRGAEMAWRRELAGRTLADLLASVESEHPDTPTSVRGHLARL